MDERIRKLKFKVDIFGLFKLKYLVFFPERVQEKCDSFSLISLSGHGPVAGPRHKTVDLWNHHKLSLVVGSSLSLRSAQLFSQSCFEPSSCSEFILMFCLTSHQSPVGSWVGFDKNALPKRHRRRRNALPLNLTEPKKWKKTLQMEAKSAVSIA